MVEGKRFQVLLTRWISFPQGLEWAMFYSNDAPGSRNQLVVPLLSKTIGKELNARVVLVEYGDYQCPQCGELYTSIKAIQRQLEAPWRDSLCIPAFSSTSNPSSSSKGSSSDRKQQGTRSVWQMYEILLEHQQELGNGYLASTRLVGT